MTRRPRSRQSRDQARRKSSPWIPVAICLALIGVVAAAYGQTVGFGFLSGPDDGAVAGEPVVRDGITSDGLAWAFAKSPEGWAPLARLSHLVDWQMFGKWAGGHHLTSVALHAVAVIGLFLVLWRMTSRAWRSAFVAAVFAIHPLHAEPVAWISARADTLAALFFVFVIGAYDRWVRKPSATGYAAVCALFAMGLLSGLSLVALPLVLLLLDFWPLERSKETPAPGGAKLILEKVPLAILSLAACFASAWIAADIPAVPWLLRIQNVLVGCAASLGDFFHPVGLACLYPAPTGSYPWKTVIGSGLVLAAITLFAIMLRKSRPFLLVGWFWYLAMLLPALAFVSTRAHADRFGHLPQIGLGIMVAWLAASQWSRWKFPAPALGCLAFVTIVTLALTTRFQVSRWSDSETLWRHALSCTTTNAYAHARLADILFEKGRGAEAVPHYQRAASLAPASVSAIDSLGVALLESGRSEEAVEHFREALALAPESIPITYHLANALLQRGDVEEAIGLYEAVLAAQPDNAGARNNLATALLGSGRVTEAIAQLEKAITLEPENSRARNNLGAALMRNGRTVEAIAQFEKATALDPAYSDAHGNLGDALLQSGRTAEAASHFSAAIDADPSNAKPGLLNRLAWILATSPDDALRDGPRAAQLAAVADRQSGGTNPVILLTVSAALAESGDFDKAARTARRALELADAQGNQNLARTLRQAIENYEAGSPLRIAPR